MTRGLGRTRRTPTATTAEASAVSPSCSLSSWKAEPRAGRGKQAGREGRLGAPDFRVSPQGPLPAPPGGLPTPLVPRLSAQGASLLILPWPQRTLFMASDFAQNAGKGACSLANSSQACAAGLEGTGGDGVIPLLAVQETSQNRFLGEIVWHSG